MRAKASELSPGGKPKLKTEMGNAVDDRKDDK